MGVVPLAFFGLSYIEFPFFPSKAEMFGFPTVWNYITWTASWLNLLLGVLIVTLTCNEITFRTSRQNIIDGLSRSQMIMAKVYFFTALALFVTAYTFFIGFVFGLIYSGFTDVFSGMEYLGVYFIQTMGYFSFAFFFAVIVKRPALSIIFYILIFFFKFIFVLTMGEVAAQFMPINVIADLTPFPFFQELFAMAGEQDPDFKEPFILSQSIRSAVAFAWMAAFIIIGYLVVKRRDL
jgi:ABC-type transport system involved in multi-copper enzyme maturation permease subunit